MSRGRGTPPDPGAPPVPAPTPAQTPAPTPAPTHGTVLFREVCFLGFCRIIDGLSGFRPAGCLQFCLYLYILYSILYIVIPSRSGTAEPSGSRRTQQSRAPLLSINNADQWEGGGGTGRRASLPGWGRLVVNSGCRICLLT